tara:strand:+ start:11229 stop:11900 length:672 start_codon:yes stop_codon:yes gene_type:complete
MQITLLLPFFAVYLGASVALYLHAKKIFDIKLVLAFSGSFLLSILVIHSLPDLFKDSSKNPGLWIMVGIVFQILLELFSGGVEHGHTHINKNNKISWLLILSLCIHAFAEGMPLSNQPELLIGIIVHKFSIGMVISILLWEIKTNLLKKLIALFIFATMTTLGSLVEESLLKYENITIIINAFVIGMLFHISTTILFESYAGHVFNFRKFIAILSGVIIATLL